MKLEKGMKLVGMNEAWRVLYVEGSAAYLCRIDSSKIIVTCRSVPDVYEKIVNGYFRTEKDKMFSVNESRLTDEAIEKYRKRRKAMDLIDIEFGPTYLGIVSRKSNKAITEAMEICGVCRASLWRTIRVYLQSGLKDYSLYDPRLFSSSSKRYGSGKNTSSGERPYRMSDEDEKYMLKVIKKYKRQDTPFYTIERAYQQLLDMYRNPISGELNDHPSYDQFYYFLRKNITAKEMNAKKLSAREARNSTRPLLGSVDNDSFGPMDLVEIDAHEVDVELVDDETHEQNIGRPILYAMIDVATRTVVSVSVAFDNNSVVGMVRLFENLMYENPVLNEHKDHPPYAWPFGVMPAAVKCDNGSDFLSHEAEMIFNKLGITKHINTAATGSLKPVVEHFFEILENRLSAVTAGNGQIRKTQTSDHKKKAVLTISQIRKIIENIVYERNTTLCEGICMTRQMIDAGVKRIPCDVWRYQADVLGRKPKPIADYDSFRYALYTRITGRITRRGLLVRGLYYIDKGNPSFIDLMSANKNKKILVLQNPSTVNYVLYKADNKDEFRFAVLNEDLPDQKSFSGMTVTEADKLRKEIRDQTKKLKQERRNVRSETDSANEAILHEARRAHKGKANNNKNIQTNREIAKAQEQKRLGTRSMMEDALSSGFFDEKNDESCSKNESQENQEKDSNKSRLEMIGDLL